MMNNQNQITHAFLVENTRMRGRGGKTNKQIKFESNRK